MLNKRKSPRRKMVLPVKVSIDRVTHLAYNRYHRYRGPAWRPPNQLQPGTIISFNAGRKKRSSESNGFENLPNEMQAGIESLEPQDNFWGVDLSDRELEAKKEMQALLTLLSSRSKSAM